MSKHTPGPWRIGDAGHTVFGPKVEGALPVTVARVGGGNMVQGHTANAALIAAAPELLEALYLALPHVEEGEEFNASHKRTLSNRIKALIAKVEGREVSNG